MPCWHRGLPALAGALLGLFPPEAASLALRDGGAADDSEADIGLSNFDCLDNDLAEQVWDGINSFVSALSSLVVTAEQGSLDTRAAWGSWATNLHVQDGGGDTALRTSCPFGLAALEIARWGACLWAGEEASETCGGAQTYFGWFMFSRPYGLRPEDTLPVFFNSRWMVPICQTSYLMRRAISLHPDTEQRQQQVRPEFDCPARNGDQVGSGIVWHRYLEVLQQTSDRYGGDNTTWRWTFGKYALRQIELKTKECALGFMAICLEKLMIFQQMMTEEYAVVGVAFISALHIFSTQVMKTEWLQDSLTVLMYTRWPILSLLCEVAKVAQGRKSWLLGHDFGLAWEYLSYQHKPYLLDFRPEEIIAPRSERAALGALAASPPEAHVAALRAPLWGRPTETYKGLLAALETTLGLSAAPSRLPSAGYVEDEKINVGEHGQAEWKVVFIYMLWGSRLAAYLPGLLRRAEAFGHGHRVLVFCLDEASCETCTASHSNPAMCVRGNLKTIYNKFTILAVVIQAGFDAFLLDVDTVFLKDPLPTIREASQNAEVLVTRDFGSHCLNIGVIYLKAHPDTAEFLASLLLWLWRHPYEFCQKAFSAFLGNEEVTRADIYGSPIKKMPRWGILDPMNAFVTSTIYDADIEGWTGRIEDIVVYHFLDGTGGADADRAVAGGYVNLFDLFYANPALELGDASRPLWEQDPEVKRQIIWARRPGPPQELRACRMIPEEYLGEPGDG